MSLTSKRENFCQHVANGLSDAEAYRRAGYKWEAMTQDTLHAEAYKLRRDPNVAARISELQAETAERNKYSRDWLLQELETVYRQAKDDKHNAAAVSALRTIGMLQGYEKHTVRHEEVSHEALKPNYDAIFSRSKNGIGSSEPHKRQNGSEAD